MTRIPLFLATVAATLATGALAQDFPKLKPGLWEMTTTMSRNPGQPMKTSICLDTSVQQDMMKMSVGMMQGMCSKFETKMSGNKLTGEAVCKLGQSTMTSKSVMVMNGDSAYRTEAHASFDPPMGGMATSDTIVEAKHAGACKPGQQPGDMMMPGGQTMNIRNMGGAPK